MFKLEQAISFLEKNIITICLTLSALLITFVLSNQLESPYLLEGMDNKIKKIYDVEGELVADLEDLDNHYDTDGFLVDVDGRLVDMNGDYYNDVGELLENEDILFDREI
tara:strand:- start:599 stop:925 length:327 start_codon:yes stop_codon:yes gene_type:complete